MAWTKDDIIAALKTVYDPEIPVNIYDLGLIYELTINKAHEVSILMTFTAPNCPMADQVMMEVLLSSYISIILQGMVMLQLNSLRIILMIPT